MAANETFFQVSKEQSIVKATIVEKYFYAWAGIIRGAQKKYNGADRIGYVDLFAGPGRYKDNSVSTPLRVLQKAVENPEYAKSLVTIFNDKDENNTQTLQSEIAALPGIENLKHYPRVWNQEVGDKIAADFAALNTIPLLAFIDPWGYKGLTLNLVNSFLKSWGCDCIFFFNYTRINAGLSNPLVKAHMAALFGNERAVELGVKLEPLSPAEREATIVEALAQALKECGHKFVLPFCFKSDKGTRTTHHLILVSKHFKAYDVMKGIMAQHSSTHEQGVPSFTFSPAASPAQQLLFALNRPLDDLEQMLLGEFAGQKLRMIDVYEQHSVDKPFIKSNYKEVLRRLEDTGRIQTGVRKSKVGFADDLVAHFPPR